VTPPTITVPTINGIVQSGPSNGITA
jgi:hypothetical protein